MNFMKLMTGAIGAGTFKTKMAMMAAEVSGVTGGSHGVTGIDQGGQTNDGTPGDITDDSDTQTTGAIVTADQQETTFI